MIGFWVYETGRHPKYLLPEPYPMRGPENLNPSAVGCKENLIEFNCCLPECILFWLAIEYRR
jgi:hypothetical protein